jgi:hypothetical protein
MCCIVSPCDYDTDGSNKGRTLSRSYLVDLFFLLVIEIFGCLHQQVDIFFHRYVIITLVAKGFKGPFLSILHAFYK